MSRLRPVYTDGPLEGQQFDTDSYGVQAVEYDAEDTAGFPFAESHIVTYQFKQFGFHMGGKSVVVWLGWCRGEPDAETVAKALLKPEIFERAEVRDMPKDLAR
jgi:hypothetical protein